MKFICFVLRNNVVTTEMINLISLIPRLCFVDVINLFVCNNEKYCRNYVYGNCLYINLPECRGEPGNETKLLVLLG